MENQATQQVWQRVFSGPQEKREDIRPLIGTAVEAQSVYRAIHAGTTGAGKELAKKLYQIQSETVSCLRGLEILSGSRRPEGKPLPQPKEPVKRLAEKSYYRALRTMTEYTARSLDSNFGVVFQKLAHQEGENCKILAQLLGMI